MNEVGGGPPGRPDGRRETGREISQAPEALLARAFVRLADTLVSDFDIVDFLYGLSVDSREILGADAAGVMLTDGRGRLRVIASSEERMRLLELFELQGAQGPCLDAFSSGAALQASASDSRARWPVFAPHASEVGFQRMCAVPLRVRDDVIGALNLFRSSDEAFTDTEMDIAQAMAEIAAVALIQERALREHNLLIEQFVFEPRPFVTHKVHLLVGHAADSGFPSDHTAWSFAVIGMLLFTFVPLLAWRPKQVPTALPKRESSLSPPLVFSSPTITRGEQTCHSNRCASTRSGQ